MSGICGVVDCGGASPDPQVLGTMAGAMAYRGPDGTGTRVHRGAGLAFAWLDTGGGQASGAQPASLDGEVWAVADARLDDREGLRAALAARGRQAGAQAGDAELILHAYAAWGRECPRHLLGDFAFAVWDAPRRRLFCARDPFGVKPFFHARAGSTLAFGNTLSSLLVHPGVGQDLDEVAIADFLLFECRQDAERTAFAAVSRLPPGSLLTFSAEGLAVESYWALPEVEVRPRPAGDVVAEFRGLLERAVHDRLTAPHAAVMMSGGLDSTSIAAVACGLLRRRGAFDLRAHTIVYDRNFPDEERRYSSMAAAALGIPVAHLPGDGYRLYEREEEVGRHFLEPVHFPLAALEADLARGAARHARIALDGWDGDALLAESPRHYFMALLRAGHIGRAAWVALRHAARARKLFPAAWRPARAGGARPPEPGFPEWIHPDFERRHALRERWAHFRAPGPPPHPVRPAALRAFEFMRRTGFFDTSDPGVSGIALEHRHPLLDLRLLDFCLALPPFPWCVGKRILREALRGELPAPVLARPKTPLAAYPYAEVLKRGPASVVDAVTATPRTLAYVEGARIPRIDAGKDPGATWIDLRPTSLDFWLRRVAAF